MCWKNKITELKVYVLQLFIVFTSVVVYGNDGVYLVRGGAIYPTTETKISMEKEILSFSVDDKEALVKVYFEFNNPEQIERKLLVGFQVPTSGGDVADEISNLNQISEFRVMQNGQIIPYTLKAANCEDCELKNPEEFQFSQANQGVFVFLFEVTFKPGLNKINHSYRFPASSNVSFSEIYNYILTTGSKWAGGQIKDLTVEVDMGENSYFYMSDVFGPQAHWNIIGSGKISDKTIELYGDISCKMIRLLSGHLQIYVQNLRPVQNIEFATLQMYANSKRLIENKSYHSYSKEELKRLRNSIYAQYGYCFKDEALNVYFSQFDWYIPNPNITIKDILLTEEEKKLVDLILELEKT